MKRKVHCLCFVLACLAALPACATPLRYSAEPIEATVIDAETKQPLEGVVVTANWQLEEGTFGGNVQAGQLMVMEAVTDKDGKFRFPGWGPTTVWRGHLVNDDPQLLLFKSGYEHERLFNDIRWSAYREHVLKPVRRSDWSGKAIALKPFRGSLEEYARHLSFLHTSINSILYRDKCAWKKIPRMVVALDEQKKFFRDNNILSSLYSIEQLSNKECGSPAEFFERPTR